MSVQSKRARVSRALLLLAFWGALSPIPGSVAERKSERPRENPTSSSFSSISFARIA